MFCTACGESLRQTDKYCGQCSSKVTGDDGDRAERGQATAPPQSYRSPFAEERIIRKFRGIKPTTHFEDYTNARFLLDAAIDVFITSDRISLLHGDEAIRQPKGVGWLLPIGGGIGFGLNILTEAAVNSYRDWKFERSIGGPPSAIEVDSMCAEGNAVFSVGPLLIEVLETKRSLLSSILDDPGGEMIFAGNFQTSSGAVPGGVLLKYSGSPGDMRGLFSRISNVEIVQTKGIPHSGLDRYYRMIERVKGFK